MVNAKFIYTGIGVRDLDRSIRFYTERLGMKLTHRSRIAETNGEIAELKSPGGNQVLELNWYADRKEYVNGDEVDHLAFAVENVDQAVTELKSQGVKVVMEPFNEGSGRLAFIEDPDGVWIELAGPQEKSG